MAVTTMAGLAGEFLRSAATVDRRAGAVLGAAADRIRDDADAMASQRWATRSDTTFSARRAGRSVPAGYVFQDGDGGFYQDVGTVNHGPNPVLGPAAERHLSSLRKALTDAVDL